MIPDPNTNLPALANVTVAPPPRRGPDSARALGPDDLPILTRQTADERALAIQLGVRIPASLDDSRPATDGKLKGRAYATVPGRPLMVRPGFLTARVLVLAGEA
jgi:hypothetical protein